MKLLQIIVMPVAAAQLAAAAPHESGVITRQSAVEIAKHEIARRGVKPPDGCRVVVEDTEIGSEIEPPIKVYQVSYVRQRAGRGQVFLTVMINKRSGRVMLFSDTRGTPSS